MLPVFSIILFFILAEIVSILLIDESKFIIDLNNPNTEMNNNYKISDGLLYYNNGSLNKRYFHNSIGYGNKTIAIIGDSFTAGGGVKNKNETFVVQLANLLNDDYKILSFGDGGLNSRQELIIFEQLVLPYNPDLVILQFCQNDAQPSKTFVSISQGQGFFVIADSSFIITSDNKKRIPSFDFLSENINKFLLHSSFVKFLSYKYNNLKYNKENSLENRLISIYSIKRINDILSKKEIPLIIINFPLAMRDYNSCNNEFTKEIENLTKKLDIEYYDLCNYLNLTLIKSEYEPPNEQGHYNKEGYYQVATLMKKIIEKNS